MRAAFSVLAFLCALSASAAYAAEATPPPDDVLRQKIVGSWGQSAACADGRLTFNADGSFVSAGATADESVKGTYSIDQGKLTGQSDDTDMPVMLVDFDGDTLLLDNGGGDPERLARCTTAQ